MKTNKLNVNKYRKKMGKRSSLMGFALAGLAAGAAAWYLFGTKEGRKALDRAMEGMSDFSETIKSKAKEGMDCVSDFADKAKNKAQSMMDSAEDTVQSKAEKAESYGKAMAKDAKDLAKSAVSKADDVVEEAKDKGKKYSP